MASAAHSPGAPCHPVKFRLVLHAMGQLERRAAVRQLLRGDADRALSDDLLVSAMREDLGAELSEYFVLTLSQGMLASDASPGF